MLNYECRSFDIGLQDFRTYCRFPLFRETLVFSSDFIIVSTLIYLNDSTKTYNNNINVWWIVKYPHTDLTITAVDSN